MKNQAMMAVLWMGALSIYAQPVLEKTYTESAGICQLESLGEVYYSMDVVNKQCHIYKMDHTLHKTISIPTPEGTYLTDIQYVSETIFNADNLVELVYSYAKYVPTETSYYYIYETKLINENGTVLLTVPGAGHTNVIEIPDQGKKFLVYEYDYSVIPYRTYTHVYTLHSSATKAPEYSSSQTYQVHPYPNPAHSQITIPIHLPDGIQSGRLDVFDMRGSRILSHSIAESSGPYILPVQQMIPGTYLYQFSSGAWRSSPHKIVIDEQQ